jgi:hypothetical protein
VLDGPELGALAAAKGADQEVFAAGGRIDLDVLDNGRGAPVERLHVEPLRRRVLRLEVP